MVACSRRLDCGEQQKRRAVLGSLRGKTGGEAFAPLPSLPSFFFSRARFFFRAPQTERLEEATRMAVDYSSSNLMS